MIGQSNMAGRGQLGDLAPIDNDKLYMLRNGRWLHLTEPVNYDRPFAGTSLATSFAHEYSCHFHCETGLIPCAEGGSSLDDWITDGQLYSHAVDQTVLARRTSEVKGILWHQGEADSEDETNAMTYPERFLAIILALKNECGLEHVPVIMGELGGFLAAYGNGKCRYYTTVNEGLSDIAESFPGYGLASSEGLTANEDGIHFNAASLREFGKRYFSKYLELSHG